MREGKIGSYEVGEARPAEGWRDHLVQEDCGSVRKGDGQSTILSV